MVEVVHIIFHLLWKCFNVAHDGGLWKLLVVWMVYTGRILVSGSSLLDWSLTSSWNFTTVNLWILQKQYIFYWPLSISFPLKSPIKFLITFNFFPYPMNYCILVNFLLHFSPNNSYSFQWILLWHIESTGQSQCSMQRTVPSKSQNLMLFLWICLFPS